MGGFIFNITIDGQSTDHQIDGFGPADYSDDELRRLAAEIVASDYGDPAPRLFRDFVVDRLGPDRVYIRPKVPFGSFE